MPSFTYWIQHADFTTTDGGPVSTEEAIRALTEHDWDAEMARARDLHQAGATDVCPPGIGFHPLDAETDLLLHICPVSWDKADVHYMYPTTMKRLFGLLPPAPVRGGTTAIGQPLDEVRHAIRLFMNEQHDDLVQLLSR